MSSNLKVKKAPVEEKVDENAEAPFESGSEDVQSDGDDDDEQALDEVDSVEEDTMPRRKLQVNNKIALERIREAIQLDPSLPWTETLTISYPEIIDVDVDNDLEREVAFYKQALASSQEARRLTSKHGLPFTRPSDYFAEMVKSDSHMERIRQRLLDETAGMKRSEDKRKEREGKRFGKQVQIEKIKERERSKKEMEERLKGLKRKRKDAFDNSQNDGEAFDVAVEDAISDRPSKRGKGSTIGSGRGKVGSGGRGRVDTGSKLSRAARDKKYGFGGTKEGRSTSKKGRGQKRLGKSRRIAAQSKR